ncbi:MAG: hypothetical protein GY869_25825 [Planctomycetes bacterium]|nr:hypothetical protein [Planctomycetota bacterium]
MNVVGMIIITWGIFISASGVFDWDFFIKTRWGRNFCAEYGRKAFQTLNIVCGLVIIVLGILVLTEVFQTVDLRNITDSNSIEDYR